MTRFALFIFWVAVAHIVGGLLVWWATQANARFFANAERGARARAKIERQVWRDPLARIGAAAQLAGVLGVLGFVLSFFAVVLIASLLKDHGSDAIGFAPFWLFIVSIALLALGILVGIPAMILCRCSKCAGALFDNSAPGRSTTVGSLQANWHVISGHGSCPRCGAPFP